MPIRAILQAIYSKRDRNGNCYWCFRYTDVASGKTVEGKVSGGESNVYSIKRGMGFANEEVHFSVVEMPIREFNRLTLDWKYAGCTAQDLAGFIRTEIAKK